MYATMAVIFLESTSTSRPAKLCVKHRLIRFSNEAILPKRA